MKKLETKYRNDELSPAELQELRNRIKSMSDYEIGEEVTDEVFFEKFGRRAILNLIACIHYTFRLSVL